MASFQKDKGIYLPKPPNFVENTIVTKLYQFVLFHEGVNDLNDYQEGGRKDIQVSGCGFINWA